MEFQAVSGPKFTGLFFVKRRRNFPSSYVFPILDMLPGSGDIRDQIRKWSKIDRNAPPVFKTCPPKTLCDVRRFIISLKSLTEILHVFGPQIFLGEHPPEFLDWDYKIQPDSDHVAKFPRRSVEGARRTRG